MQTVFRAWRENVLKHPEAYLEHRSVVMLRFLGVSKLEHLPYFYGIPQSLYPAYIKDRSYYLRFPSTRVRKWEGEWLHLTEYWAFRPWIYGALTIAILLFTWKNRGTAFWLCASGAAYWSSSFFSIPSTDFRYGWWDVLAVSTALTLIIVQWLARLEKREVEHIARFQGGSRKHVIEEEPTRK
jgi:hypothetical protein